MKDPLRYFEKAIKAKYHLHEAIPARKLCDLVAIDVSWFDMALRAWSKEQEKNLIDSEVDRDQFCTYAVTKEEIRRYDLAKGIADLLMRAKTEYKPGLPLPHIASGMQQILGYDLSGNIWPNPNFVQGL